MEPPVRKLWEFVAIVELQHFINKLLGREYPSIEALQSELTIALKAWASISNETCINVGGLSEPVNSRSTDEVNSDNP